MPTRRHTGHFQPKEIVSFSFVLDKGASVGLALQCGAISIVIVCTSGLSAVSFYLHVVSFLREGQEETLLYSIALPFTKYGPLMGVVTRKRLRLS